MTRETPPSISRLKIGALAVTLCCLAVAFWQFKSILTMENLKMHHKELSVLVSQYPVGGPMAIMMGIVMVGMLCMPGQTPLCIAAGFFYPQPYATLYTWTGTWIGATCCYCLVRYTTDDIAAFFLSKARSNSYFKSIEEGLRKDELLYMVLIRYMVFVPFFVVNISAAVLGVSFPVFFITTFFATIPGCLMQCTAGRGLEHFIDEFNGEGMLSILYRTMMNEDISWTIAFLVLNSIVWACILFYLKRRKAPEAESKVQ